MKRKVLLISFIALFLAPCFQPQAQIVITNDSTAADASAMLDVKSPDKGVKFPQLTSEQIQSIVDPAIGLTVFCTSDNNYYVFTGSDSVQGSAAPGNGILKWKLLGGQALHIPPMCMCLMLWQSQTTFTCCPNDPAFKIDPPGFIWNYRGGCSSTPLYSWDGINYTPGNPSVYITPSMLSCGKYTYTWSAKVGTTIKCSRTYTVFVFPKCITMQNLVTNETRSSCQYLPPLEFCEGQEGVLSTDCADFEVSWDFKDPPYTQDNTWCPPTYPPPPCTGTPIFTNQLDIACPPFWPNDYYIQRIYRAKFDKTKLPAGWPAWPAGCPNEFFIPANIYCPTVAGNITATSSGHIIQPGNKICSDNNGDGWPDYPVNLTLTLSNWLGHIVGWNSTSYNAPSYPFSITAKGTYTIPVEVRNGNGICASEFTNITIIVEDPFHPLITSTKDLVCPNTTDDVITLANAGNLPAGAQIQWQYQIDCNGPWYPVTYNPYDPSNGISQNTNLIGDQNPWYKPPRATLLTSSLCWRVVITPSAGSACTNPTRSSDFPVHYEGRIDLFVKPGTPGISVTPLPPQCCGTTFTLTGTAPATGTQPFYFEWYHDGQLEWVDPNPGTAGSTSIYAVTEPGDYLVRVYNKDHCEWTESSIIHITCCKVNLSVVAPCCSDGITPITIVATASSNCNLPITYLWTGTPPYSSVLSTIVLSPPPTFPPQIWSYTVTATDAMGCHDTKTVDILACP